MKETMLKHIIRDMNDGVLVLDLEGKVRSAAIIRYVLGISGWRLGIL